MTDTPPEKLPTEAMIEAGIAIAEEYFWEDVSAAALRAKGASK